MSDGPVARRFLTALEEAAAALRMPVEEPAVALARRFGVGGFVERYLGSPERPAGIGAARRLRERLLLEAASEISAELTAGAVPHCFARGIALLHSEYQPGDREMADLDLYVEPRGLAVALEALASFGYRELPPHEQGGPAALRSRVDFVRHPARSDFEAAAVDLHWGVEPVDRLLPRPGSPLPDDVWETVDRSGPFPKPRPAHHLALLVHHLVHHDLLHVRGLLDMALVLAHGPVISGPEFESLARRLGVLRAARLLHTVLVQEFGLSPIDGVGDSPTDWRARRLRARLRLPAWLLWAATGRGDEHVRVTGRRVATRLLTVDQLRELAGVVRDAVCPPREHLRWRWPETASLVGAWRRHLWHVLRGVATSSR